MLSGWAPERHEGESTPDTTNTGEPWFIGAQKQLKDHRKLTETMKMIQDSNCLQSKALFAYHHDVVVWKKWSPSIHLASQSQTWQSEASLQELGSFSCHH